jgi:hypothetical protein
MCLWLRYTGLVHRFMCVSNICHGGFDDVAMLTHVIMKELYYICDIVMWPSCEDQDEAWLDGPDTRVKGKLRLCWGDGEAWARLGSDGPTHRWRETEVKIDGPRASRDDMKWIISFDDCVNALVALAHWRTMESMKEMEMRKAKV